MKINAAYHVNVQQIADELEMIEASKKDATKFEFLYKKYHEPIFRFIYQRVENKEQAFDSAQQVFLNALLHLNKYEYRGVPFSSWLYRIALNEVKQLFRSQKVGRTINIDALYLEALAEEIQEPNNDNYLDKLPDAIARLSSEELYMVEMRFFEKRPFKEIGEILEITEGNAKIRMYRVLEKLKKIITGAINY